MHMRCVFQARPPPGRLAKIINMKMLVANLLFVLSIIQSGTASSCETEKESFTTNCEGSMLTYSCPPPPSVSPSFYSYIIVTQLPERNSSKYYPDDSSYIFHPGNGSGFLSLDWGREYLLTIVCQPSTSYNCSGVDINKTVHVQDQHCQGIVNSKIVC